MRQQLLEALAEVISDHSIASTQGVFHVIRRRVCAEDDVELDCALIRAQFIIASRRYLRAPRRMMRVMGTNPRVGLHPRAEPAPERHDGSAAPEN
jgi:hypothetical protein